MERDEITRKDLPIATDGYDRRSVDAHLEAVAAFSDSLRARIEALVVEIETLRAGGAPDAPDAPADFASEALTPPVLPESSPAAAAGRSEDPVSARLVASKLYLDGSGRDEIIERLSSEYRLDDPGALVDEVIEGLS